MRVLWARWCHWKITPESCWPNLSSCVHTCPCLMLRWLTARRPSRIPPPLGPLSWRLQAVLRLDDGTLRLRLEALLLAIRDSCHQGEAGV